MVFSPFFLQSVKCPSAADNALRKSPTMHEHSVRRLISARFYDRNFHGKYEEHDYHYLSFVEPETFRLRPRRPMSIDKPKVF